MTTPADAASQEVDDEVDTDKQVSFEAKINTLADAITRDEKGKYVIPEDLSEAERYALIAEKRRRDTQSEYTRTAQEAKALKAEKAALLKKVASAVTVEITPAQAEELEELKFSDPEAWRKKVNAYERDASQKQQKVIDDELRQVSASSLETEELERRKQVLAEFNQAHPDLEFTDELIANDIPPRIVKRLETGVISFEAFLQECYDYTKTGKVIKQEALPGKQPNLSKVGGGSKPDDNAVKEDIVLSYKNEVF